MLCEFISCYRLLHFSFPDFQAAIPFKPYPPRPETCLSFYPRDTEKTDYPDTGKTVSSCRSVVFGQHSMVTNRYVGRDFLVIQVVFKPFGLFRLTGIPAQVFTNNYVDAETVFPKELRRLNERLSSTNDKGEMIALVEDYLELLVKQIKKIPHPLDTVSQILLQGSDKFSLDYLARESCLSTRQFERKFIERVGINPKYFSRIVRFDKVFRMKNALPETDWLTLALQSGYYDYQHLVKDYQEFTRYSPTQFYQQDTQAPERHFGIAET